MLAPLDGPVAVGSAVLPRAGAIVLAASIVIAGIVAAFALRTAWRDPELATSRVTIAAWLGALIVPALFGFNPARSFSLIGLALLCAVVHLAIVRWWPARGVAHTLLATVVGGDLVLALVALAMQITHHPSAVYAANLGRATGLFVTPNQFAAWLVPSTALAAGVALWTPSRTLRGLAAAGAVAGAVTLFATFSLGGWIGGAAAFAIAAWWLGRRALAIGWVALVIVSACAVTFAPGIAHHRSSERFVRLDATRAGLRIASAFPLLGVGPLAYPLVYPAFRVPSSTEDSIISEHPHDVVLSLFADTGVAGVLAIAFGWWRIGCAIRAAYVRADTRTRRLTACICAGLIGRFVHGLVDLVGVLELAFVWMPFAALALATARGGVAAHAAPAAPAEPAAPAVA